MRSFESGPAWIVIPAYNEEKILPTVLGELSALPYKIVVVDDGSLDGTLEAARAFPVTILRHLSNLGQGAALQTGIQYALETGQAGAVVTFDADGQHNPGDIARLLEPLSRGYDAVLGSRFMQGGAALEMPYLKRTTLWLAVRVTRWMTGLPLTDTHNGLRAFSREAAERIRIRQNGMAHASEILNQVAALKLKWCEVPVIIRYTSYSRRKGQSILNSVNILWDILMGKVR